MAQKKADLAKLTKEDLLKLAKKEGVKADAAMKKEEIADLIVKGAKPAPKAAKAAAPVKKAPAKAAVKTVAKKETKTAKKAAPAKAEKPAKAKAPVKKAPAKKAVVKKAAEEVAAPVKKAAATAAKTVKETAPKAEKKAAPVKKATVKTVEKTVLRIKKPSLDEANDTIRGESKKFEIEDRRGYIEPSYELAGEPAYELPEEYGDTRITLLVQDPYWLHAYWEINSDSRKKHGLASASGKEVLVRVFNGKSGSHFDVKVNPGSRSWYFNVPETNQPYFVELGTVDMNGKFVSIVRSNLVLVPADKAAMEIDHAWKAGSEEAREELFKKSGGYMIHKLVGSQVVSEWIADTTGRSSASGSISSGSGGMGSVPSQKVVGKRRSFWAELHTELIVYGATEPDADVTVGGVPMKLTPDGKFSIRFYLKDGDHPVPFVATSNDRVDTIEITPFVSKHTERKEYRNK